MKSRNNIGSAEGLLLVDDYHGQRALEVDGVIFSVAVEDGKPTVGYWTAMLPAGRPRSALLLGLGGGRWPTCSAGMPPACGSPAWISTPGS